MFFVFLDSLASGVHARCSFLSPLLVRLSHMAVCCFMLAYDDKQVRLLQIMHLFNYARRFFMFSASLDKESRYFVTSQNTNGVNSDSPASNFAKRKKLSCKKKISSGSRNDARGIIKDRLHGAAIKKHSKMDAKNFSEAFAIAKDLLVKSPESFRLPKDWAKKFAGGAKMSDKKTSIVQTNKSAGKRIMKEEVCANEDNQEGKAANDVKGEAPKKILSVQKSARDERIKKRKDNAETAKVKSENDAEVATKKRMSASNHKSTSGREHIIVTAQAVGPTESILGAGKSEGDAVGKKVMRILRESLIKARDMYPDDFLASFGNLNLHLDSETPTAEKSGPTKSDTAHCKTNRKILKAKKKDPTPNTATDDHSSVPVLKRNGVPEAGADCNVNNESQKAATSASAVGASVAGLRKKSQKVKPSTSSHVLSHKSAVNGNSVLKKGSSETGNKIRESLVGKPPLFGRMIHLEEEKLAEKRVRKASPETNGGRLSTSSGDSEKQEVANTSSDDINLRTSKRHRAGSGFYR